MAKTFFYAFAIVCKSLNIILGKAGNILHWESCSAVKHGSDLNVVEYSNPEIRSHILCYKICGFINEIETLLWSKKKSLEKWQYRNKLRPMSLQNSTERRRMMSHFVIFGYDDYFWTWIKRPLINSKKLFFHFNNLNFRNFVSKILDRERNPLADKLVPASTDKRSYLRYGNQIFIFISFFCQMEG